MCVQRNLLIGVACLSLLSGTVLAQAPAQPQGGVWEGGQFKAQNSPSPKSEDACSSGTGMWIIIGLVVLATIIWLANAKPKGGPVPVPIPFPLPGYRKPANSSGAVWSWIGLGLLALVIYGCVSDKSKPVAPSPQVQPLQPVQQVPAGQWWNNNK